MISNAITLFGKLRRPCKIFELMELTKKYNQSTRLTGNESIDTDLNKYVTEKAIEGLFHLVEIEEKAIRKDPLQRTSDLLKKVFGSL